MNKNTQSLIQHSKLVFNHDPRYEYSYEYMIVKPSLKCLIPPLKTPPNLHSFIRHWQRYSFHSVDYVTVEIYNGFLLDLSAYSNSLQENISIITVVNYIPHYIQGILEHYKLAN